MFVIFQGIMEELMLAADPMLYRKYILHRKKGEALLYVCVQKEMCGYLKNLLIFYEELVDELELYVFEINPYDPFIENKTVDGKQLIIRWHMDDIKLSPVDKKVFSSTILCMESVYGEMHGTRGKRHGYLSMWMEYLNKGN